MYLSIYNKQWYFIFNTSSQTAQNITDIDILLTDIHPVDHNTTEKLTDLVTFFTPSDHSNYPYVSTRSWCARLTTTKLTILYHIFFLSQSSIYVPIYPIYNVICGILGYEWLIWMILRMSMSSYYGMEKVIKSVNLYSVTIHLNICLLVVYLCQLYFVQSVMKYWI